MSERVERPLQSRLVIAIATVVIGSIILYVLIAKPFKAEGTKLTAEFGQAGQGLGTTSPVKIRGMQIGRVSEIELLPNGRARITMTLTEDQKVPVDAVASLEPASVFGPKFINLIPGATEASGPFLASGQEIKKTSDPRDLNDLLADASISLGALDPKEVSIIVDSLGQGLGGQGDRLRQTVDQVNEIVRVAHKHRKNAELFLDDLARLASVQGAGEDIAALVTQTNAVIDTAANGDGRLRGFADGVSGVSGLTAHGFNKHGSTNLRAAFHTGENAISVIGAQLGLTGDAVRTILRLLPIYKQVAWAPTGDPNKKMLGTMVMLPANPCHILLGVCPSGASPKKGGK